jgi:hypothetical protein
VDLKSDRGVADAPHESRSRDEAEILAEFRVTTVAFAGAAPLREETPRRGAIRHAADQGLTGAALREEVRRLMAEEREAGVYEPKTEAEVYAMNVRFAQEHDRRVRPPLQAIRISRESGAITGVVLRRNAPIHGAARVHVARPRERRSSSQRRGSSRASPDRPSAADPDDADPPRVARTGGRVTLPGARP